MPRAADLIVEVLDAEPRGLPASELARRIRRHDGNVRRVLGQLHETGIVERTPGRRRDALWYRTGRPAPAAPTPKPPNPRITIPAHLYLRLKDEAERTGRTLTEAAADVLADRLLESESKETTAA